MGAVGGCSWSSTLSGCCALSGGRASMCCHAPRHPPSHPRPAPTAGPLPQILVGNKSDMADERRAVPYARAKALADEYGIAFFETSAKDNINVEEVGRGASAGGGCCCGAVAGD
jgi:hypothetical protein